MSSGAWRRPDTRVSHETSMEVCGHRQLWKMNHPLPGEMIMCQRCGVGRKIATLRTCYWQADCTDCEWLKTTGQRKKEAIEHGRTHAETMGHVVNVITPTLKLAERLVPEALQPPLFVEELGPRKSGHRAYPHREARPGYIPGKKIA